MSHPEVPPSLAEEYQVLERLGSGAMGQVYLATQRRLRRRVALKFLHRTDDPELTARFTREAEALARLQHPNIVEVYDHGVAEGVPYLAMEFLDGRSLLGQRPEDPLAAMLPVAEALEAVHAAELVHRDVKPANIMRTGDGRVVLVDFGLLRAEDSNTLTKTGALVGTPVYLAPEVLVRGAYGPASDWWAWGVTLFELTTGEKPFSADQVMGALAGESLEAPEVPGDPRIQRVVAACLNPDPAERPRTREALVAVAAGYDAAPSPETGPRPGPERSGARRGFSSTSEPRPRPRRRGPLLLGLAALGLAGLAILAPLASEPSLPDEAVAPGPARPAPVELVATVRVTPQGSTVFRTRLGRHALLVPDGTFVSRLSSVPEEPGPEERIYLSSYLFDERPVSQGEYARYLETTGRAPPPSWERQRQDEDDRPVVGLTYAEAEAFAAWAGGRLPTATEWARAAGGITGEARPWEASEDLPRGLRAEGDRPRGEPRLEHRDRAGVPEGPGATGALGMFGNVAAWVDGPGGPAVMGAATSDRRELRCSWLLRPAPESGRAPWVGLRVAYDAGPEAIRAQELDPETPLAERTTRVAQGLMDRRGGHLIVELPAVEVPLRVRTSSHDGPPGPARMTEVPALRMDRDEVTAGRFSLYAASTGDAPDFASWRDDQLEQWWLPVYHVTWDQARAFCEWSGGRLPTPEEWERAANGGEGRTFPWGEAPPRPLLANYGIQDVEARFKAKGYVKRPGQFPRGHSADGLRDMAGNLYEWTAGREGADALMMGGNYISPPELLRTYAARRWPAASAEIAIGFRCAYGH